MVNPKLYSTFGEDLRAGKFEKLNPASYEYKELWQEQLSRCINGYSVGGEWISGRLYTYINFGTISIISETTGRKTIGAPKLRDVEREVFGLFERALQEKKGLLYISGRRGGKSFIGSFLIAYDFTFYDNSKTICTAGSVKYVDGIMKMVKDHLDGFASTEFYIPRKTDKIEKGIYSGYEEKTHSGWKDKLSDRIIYNRNFSSDITACNGLSANVIVFEEIGMWSTSNPLTECYTSAQPCFAEGLSFYGVPLLFGTGGDMESGASMDAKKMFEDPETYNLLSFADEESPDHKTAFFLPAWKVLNDYKDEYGISKKAEAIAAIKEEREKLKKAKDLAALLKKIQYYPLTPEEAFLVSTGNNFPIELLQNQVETIVRDKKLFNLGQKGFCDFDNGEIVFKPNALAREVGFPITKGGQKEGCVTIYEHPIKIGDKVPMFVYIAGTDPYAQDKAESSDSVASTFIFKRFYDSEHSYNQIVAEYTGRPESSEQYYDNLRKLLLYYNAKTLYENNINELKVYFQVKLCTHLLFPQPGIVDDILKESLTDRRFGIHMTQQIKFYLIQEINNYLREEFEEGHYNTEKIFSIPLLQELINYNDKGNFDRVIAFGLCLIQNREMFRMETKKLNEMSSNDSFKEFNQQKAKGYFKNTQKKYLNGMMNNLIK